MCALDHRGVNCGDAVIINIHHFCISVATGGVEHALWKQELCDEPPGVSVERPHPSTTRAIERSPLFDQVAFQAAPRSSFPPPKKSGLNTVCMNSISVEAPGYSGPMKYRPAPIRL